MTKEVHSFPRSRRWTVFVLAAILLFSIFLPISAKALVINGEGNGIGGASSTSNGSYTLNHEEVHGFRFSLVDDNGNRVYHKNSSGTTVQAAIYDIYEDATITAKVPTYITAGRFSQMKTKIELQSSYSSLRFNITELSGGPSNSNFYDSTHVKDSAWGLSLPTTAAAMETWITNPKLTTILSKAWGVTTEQYVANGWHLVIEPIFVVNVNHVHMLSTVTEIAILAVADGTTYSATSGLLDAHPNSINDSSTWAFVSTYTHCYWPVSLTLRFDQFGIKGDDLDTLYLANTTSRKIITEGYGIMVVSPEETDAPAVYKITLDHQSGTSSLGQFYESYGTKFFLTPESPTAITSIGTLPKRTGYTFGGYYTSPNGGGTQVVDASGKILVANTYFKADQTIYAKWTENFLKVVYHSNSATEILWQGSATTETYLNNSLYNSYFYATSYTGGLRNGNSTTHLYMTKTGYTLTGYWIVDSPSGTIRIHQDDTSCPTGKALAEKMGYSLDTGSKTVHVYAEWKPITATVTFHRNTSGTDTVTSSQTFSYGLSGQKFADPGWTRSS